MGLARAALPARCYASGCAPPPFDAGQDGLRGGGGDPEPAEGPLAGEVGPVLVLTRRKQERIIIGDDIEVTVVAIQGDQVRLGIAAPPSVTIHRKEVYDAIQQENRRAAEASAEALRTAFARPSPPLAGAGLGSAPAKRGRSAGGPASVAGRPASTQSKGKH